MTDLPSKQSKTIYVTSCANDTKWRELQQHMARQWERAPYWRAKYLPKMERGIWHFYADIDFAYGEGNWDRDWFYHFRSDNIYRRLEWVDIRPSSKDGDMPIDEIIMTCRAIGFDFEISVDVVRVYGYRRRE